MNQGRIIVITGSPGTGKTTTASAVAKESDLEKNLIHAITKKVYQNLMNNLSGCQTDTKQNAVTI